MNLWAGRKLGVRQISEDASYICHVLRRCRCIRPHLSGRALYREAFRVSCGCFTIAEYLFGLSSELGDRGSRSLELFHVLVRWGAIPTVMHLLEEWCDTRNTDLEGDFVAWAYDEAHVVADLKSELLHVHALMEEHRQLASLKHLRQQRFPPEMTLRVGEFLRDRWETAQAVAMLFQGTCGPKTETHFRPSSEDLSDGCEACNELLPYVGED
jgi:hypothetical protein